uniref:Putative proline-rich salivary protein n=1 Tax=Amblyomma triste TaxID=251400 RepID=A0A023G4T5_AMBTT
MANMRIAVAALVCLCMVALTYAQGGVLGRTCRGPQCGGRNIGQRPQGGRQPSQQGQHTQGGLQPNHQGQRPPSGRPRPNSLAIRPQSGGRLPPSTSSSSERSPDYHPGSPGYGYMLLEDAKGPRSQGSPDRYAQRYSGRD